MDYVPLGRSGLKVSPLCLGTMMFGGPTEEADAARIAQMLANLIANAVKFTPEGGRIDLTARREGNAIEFAVADTGPGIPADDVAHIFDRYWHARRTAQTRGTGLGLAIARGIVEAHDGRIWAESEEGRGATFYFTLPTA